MAETGSWSEYFITEAGRKFRQQCIAEGHRPVFTRAAIGSGKPDDGVIIDTMQDLVAYERDVIIKKSYLLEANHLCVVRIVNDGAKQDVFMTEVGVYAKLDGAPDDTEILYGYSYIPDGYVRIPAQAGENTLKVYELTLDTYLSRSTEIKIVFDASTIYVSHEDLDDALGSITEPTTHIATITHEFPYTPMFALYKTDHAFGTQRFGAGPFGGGPSRTVSDAYEVGFGGQVDVYSTNEFSEGAKAVRHSKNQVAFLYDGSHTNLLLKMR